MSARKTFAEIDRGKMTAAQIVKQYRVTRAAVCNWRQKGILTGIRHNEIHWIYDREEVKRVMAGRIKMIRRCQRANKLRGAAK